MSTNRFAATCARCGEPVAPGAGLVSGGKSAAGDWRVVHDGCIPVSVSTQPNWNEVLRPWIVGLEYDL